MIHISELSVTNSLVYALNNMFSNLLSSINANITSSLDKIVFITPDITKNLTSIVGSTSFTGINLICNALIYGFLLYYAASYLLSHITFSQVEKPHQFVFKLLLCSLALNASLEICSGIILICSNISNLICELGNYLFDFNISFTGFIENVLPADYFTSNSFSLFSFDRCFKIFNILWLIKSCNFVCY